jgi:glycosyltransferase involved in cell wall biosynthesis
MADFSPDMTGRLKISVITAVYNNVSTIEDTILSVISQTYPNVEHIIIDGASTDGTVDVIRKHVAKIAVVKSEPDHGIYDAMNRGLALAKGDIIGFLNGDDIYADSSVLEAIARTIETQKVDACYGDLVYVDRNNVRKIVRYWKSQAYRGGLFEKGWMPAHPTFYAKRQVYEKYGGYDTTYRRQSDFELTLRFLAVHKIKSAYIPRVLIRMRSGGASRELMHILEGNIEAYHACRKHSLKVTPFFIARKILSRVPQFFRREWHEASQ